MRALLLAALLTACTVYPPQARAQTPRFVVLDDYVRERLAADWRAAQGANAAVQHERAYCLGYQLDFWGGELSYRVTQLEPAKERFSTVHSIAFECPKGEGRAELHVHPPTTCAGEDGPCWLGGPYGYQCLASDQDYRYLALIGEPWGLVQCDEHAIVTFFAPRTLGLLHAPD